MDRRPSNEREVEVYRGNARLPTAASRRNPLVRLLTDRRFALRVVRYALGMPVPMETEDRRLLEGPIFEFFVALLNTRRVLFVGCDWYTKHYEQAFFKSKDFWTIDPLARTQRFGARQHIVAPLQDLARHFPEGHFDLIVCNGVYGFGLDTREQCEAALEQCYLRLAAGGHFVFGWDDIPERNPVPLSDAQGLERFNKFIFPAFGSWRHRTNTPYRHTYDFYSK